MFKHVGVIGNKGDFLEKSNKSSSMKTLVENYIPSIRTFCCSRNLNQRNWEVEDCVINKEHWNSASKTRESKFVLRDTWCHWRTYSRKYNAQMLVTELTTEVQGLNAEVRTLTKMLLDAHTVEAARMDMLLKSLSPKPRSTWVLECQLLLSVSVIAFIYSYLIFWYIVMVLIMNEFLLVCLICFLYFKVVLYVRVAQWPWVNQPTRTFTLGLLLFLYNNTKRGNIDFMCKELGVCF